MMEVTVISPTQASWSRMEPLNTGLRFLVAFTLKHDRLRGGPVRRCRMGNLLHYALVFLVIALIAAAVGFGGVAGFAMEAAQLLFWVFIILFVVSLVASIVRRA